MNNIRATLATVWRIASPYFRSEDKWAARGLLAAVIALELLNVAVTLFPTGTRIAFATGLRGDTNGELGVAAVVKLQVTVPITLPDRSWVPLSVAV